MCCVYLGKVDRLGLVELVRLLFELLAEPQDALLEHVVLSLRLLLLFLRLLTLCIKRESVLVNPHSTGAQILMTGRGLASVPL
jgi:hypothetical protein